MLVLLLILLLVIIWSHPSYCTQNPTELVQTERVITWPEGADLCWSPSSQHRPDMDVSTATWEYMWLTKTRNFKAPLLILWYQCQGQWNIGRDILCRFSNGLTEDLLFAIKSKISGYSLQTSYFRRLLSAWLSTLTRQNKWKTCHHLLCFAHSWISSSSSALENT